MTMRLIVTIFLNLIMDSDFKVAISKLMYCNVYLDSRMMVIHCLLSKIMIKEH